MRVDRASRSAHVDKPALSFGLLMQPDVLAEVADNRRFRGSGLLARFLFAVPASNVGRRDVRAHAPIPAGVRDEYERRLHQLLEGVPGPVTAPKVLTLTDAAREAWLDMAQAIELEQGDGGRYESISDWTSKLPGAVARIAALFELAEMGLAAEEVSHAAMDRAIHLARLLIPHAQAAFGLLGTDATDSDAAAIVKWVQGRRSGGVHQARGAEGAGGALPVRGAAAEGAGAAGATGRSARVPPAQQGRPADRLLPGQSEGVAVEIGESVAISIF
jgi:replicative DNA helicase